MAREAFSSNMGSPVSLDKAANSRIIVPAQAVQVSPILFTLPAFMPCRRFTLKTHEGFLLLNIGPIVSKEIYYKSYWLSLHQLTYTKFNFK